MTYHVCLTLTAAAVFGLFVYGEKLLLNHKMNKLLPWYVVLSLYSPSASKLSSFVHFSDNFSASGLYNSIQHTTEMVYSQNIII